MSSSRTAVLVEIRETLKTTWTVSSVKFQRLSKLDAAFAYPETCNLLIAASDGRQEANAKSQTSIWYSNDHSAQKQRSRFTSERWFSIDKNTAVGSVPKRPQTHSIKSVCELKALTQARVSRIAL